MKKRIRAYLASFHPYHRVIRLLAVLSLLGLIAILVGNLAIRQASAQRCHDSITDVPHRTVGLVLGCVKTLPNGRRNLFFHYRINAAAALFQAGKVDYLIVSGDNHRDDYDEPTDMRDALVDAGVPADRIYRDYAGFRTLDSVVRARKVFGQTEMTVISQRFHNERAVFIAREHGIDAIGFNAREVESLGGLRTRLREQLARFKTVLDVWVLDTEPRFLGREVALGGPVT